MPAQNPFDILSDPEVSTKIQPLLLSKVPNYPCTNRDIFNAMSALPLRDIQISDIEQSNPIPNAVALGCRLTATKSDNVLDDYTIAAVGLMSNDLEPLFLGLKVLDLPVVVNNENPQVVFDIAVVAIKK